jgi:hypothetical protein
MFKDAVMLSHDIIQEILHVLEGQRYLDPKIIELKISNKLKTSSTPSKMTKVILECREGDVLRFEVDVALTNVAKESEEPLYAMYAHGEFIKSKPLKTSYYAVIIRMLRRTLSKWSFHSEEVEWEIHKKEHKIHLSDTLKLSQGELISFMKGLGRLVSRLQLELMVLFREESEYLIAQHRATDLVQHLISIVETSPIDLDLIYQALSLLRADENWSDCVHLLEHVHHKFPSEDAISLTIAGAKISRDLLNSPQRAARLYVETLRYDPQHSATIKELQALCLAHNIDITSLELPHPPTASETQTDSKVGADEGLDELFDDFSEADMESQEDALSSKSS